MYLWIAIFAVSSGAASATNGFCDIGIVGAGPGGAYAAWRAALAGRSVCVFELASRPGGRIHSLRKQGPKNDLNVEAGAYRFAPHPVFAGSDPSHAWLIYNPLTTAIIKELGLHSAIYNPNASQWDHGMHKIVDKEGNDAGYLTFVEQMLHNATLHGAQVHFNAKVVGISSSSNGTLGVKLASGKEYAVETILLNIPQHPIIELLRNSSGPISTMFPRALYNPISDSIMKLYVHYNDAWWRNDIGLVAGSFRNGPKEHKCVGWDYTPAQEPAPVQGSYHDGDFRCDGANGRCRGFLQTYYGGDPGVSYYKPFIDSIRSDAVVHITPSKPHHAELLSQVHASLVEFHRKALDAVNATSRVSEEKPTGAVLSMWDQGVSGIHAGCHSPKPGNNPKDVTAAAFNPFPGWRIFVANEAYGTLNCFAEGSLVMADAFLQQMNINSLSWYDDTIESQYRNMQRPPTDPAIPFFDNAVPPPLGKNLPADSIVI